MPKSTNPTIELLPKGRGAFRLLRGKTGCLLVHGLTGTPWAFQELAGSLADQGISVSAPLLPGHGTRPHDLIGVHWTQWVDSIRNECRLLQSVCEEWFLLGHSMGGSICLFLAGEFPVRGVISLSAPVRFRGWWVPALPYLKSVKRFWKKRHKPASGDAGYDRYPLSSLSEMLVLLNELERKLPKINCPALIMHAVGDRTVPSNNADLIYERIGSKEKKKILLSDPCHLIMKGNDSRMIQMEVLSFVKINSR